MPEPSRHADPPPAHIPVLVDAVVSGLAPAAGEVLADCTAGLGGHAAVIGRRLAPGGVVVVNDLDPAHVARAVARVRAAAPGVEVREVRGNFADLPRAMDAMGARADMVLADLGFASPHVDDPQRGFSFARPGPLDMRYGPGGLTAADLVNTLSEAELGDALRELGEERCWRRLAAEITRTRRATPFRTTAELAEVCRRVVPRSADGLDPATRTFQALRILVNDELGSLDALLAAVERGARAAASGRADWLAEGARVAIISFHSLEDRRVKRAMAGWAEAGLIGRPGRPVTADPQERTNNPRSRSAKLRVARLRRASVV